MVVEEVTPDVAENEDAKELQKSAKTFTFEGNPYIAYVYHFVCHISLIKCSIEAN